MEMWNKTLNFKSHIQCTVIIPGSCSEPQHTQGHDENGILNQLIRHGLKLVGYNLANRVVFQDRFYFTAIHFYWEYKSSISNIIGHKS